ncbi:GNAT family N-acetyltransferase [Nocardia terpenica]|uniref:GNAT family N-acetyltransferase n=1 Tax=Nocardia terpenica TaxID=455432 RepID=UPI0018940AA8|nr:GNAT family N-acetyltransferase [Nocardia terpenica]MBF6065447.1 GNAT family N-acetyltransferase [Nocardia terpenica]MBF6109129.1 GNAT family N-acetyltransferase [Nocardia terpenica]MBF6114669.1 GNAT family N-acetyltransferase [Nocardia terpenica]MBF6123354.1 GNAT family N-acetyltransferase [Nocardia terpenica]MBF6156628.1 GNAT family N-acetyltransferase [Nocardia terpenica]
MSSVSPVTEVVTERLVLRCWTRAEIDAVLAGQRLSHWAADFPAEGDRVVAGLMSDHPGWLTGYGHRLVVERGSGLIVGSIGLFWPPSNRALEIGYGIVSSRRGRGYAPEAVRALTEFAFTAPEVHTVFAKVELSNPASVRVLEKSGFQPQATSADENVIELRMTRTEGNDALVSGRPRPTA